MAACRTSSCPMDQPQENNPPSQQPRKKTLRDIYANAASGLLLMNDSVVEELRDLQTQQENNKAVHPEDQSS
jgi:hypothetical protein